MWLKKSRMRLVSVSVCQPPCHSVRLGSLISSEVDCKKITNTLEDTLSNKHLGLGVGTSGQIFPGFYNAVRIACAKNFTVCVRKVSNSWNSKALLQRQMKKDP